MAKKKNTQKKDIKIISSQNDGLIMVIELGGKKYKLQHPGNRKWLEWRQESVDVQTGSVDMAGLLDNAFEHCVIPEGHDFKPTLDNVRPADLEVWQLALRKFLGGELISE